MTIFDMTLVELAARAAMALVGLGWSGSPGGC